MSEMKTPEEAKKLMCPFLKGHSGQLVDGELVDIIPSYQQNCTADKCMMWQWEQIRDHPTPPPGSAGISFNPAHSPIINGTEGYCSLISVKD